MCLRQGTTPVFIPPREPWRNGTIERFNDTFDQRFFRQERFTGVEHLTERAGAFERFHNPQHRYSATRGLAPDETSTASKQATHADRARPAPRRLAQARHGRVHPLHPLRSQAAGPRPRDPDARRQRLPVRHRHARPRDRSRRAQPSDQQRPRRVAQHRPDADPRPLTPPRKRAARERRLASPSGLGSATITRSLTDHRRSTSPGKRCAGGNPTR